MRKICLKSLIWILTLIMILNVCTAISYSADNFDLSKYGNDAAPSGGTDASAIIEPTRSIAGVIVSAVRIVGTGVALIMITVIAIKYLLAAPGDRADMKKSSFQYVVGAVIVFGSTQILGILIQVFPGLVSN